jgi:hypothetical protein
VSPWWKTTPALLEPGRATLAGTVRAGGEGWQGALEALEALLAERRLRRLNLVLSNHFVRYLVVPEDAQVRSPAERNAYLAHHFAAVYGERAAHWSFAAERGGDGTCLAAAVDAELIGAARAMAARRKTALARAEPLAAAAFNRARRRLGGGARFFAVLEPGRVCLLLLDGGRVVRVASQRCADAQRELERLLAMEALDAGFDAASRPPLEVAEPLAA